MLAIFAIIFLMIGLGIGFFLAFADFMSDAPGGVISVWPMWVFIALSIVCFMLHFLLHGRTMHW